MSALSKAHPVNKVAHRAWNDRRHDPCTHPTVAPFLEQWEHAIFLPRRIARVTSHQLLSLS